MENLSWIWLFVCIGLVVYIYFKNKDSEEDEECLEVEIVYVDGKMEKFTDVESYELEEFDDFLSIYLKGEDPAYIKIKEIRKIQVRKNEN